MPTRRRKVNEMTKFKRRVVKREKSMDLEDLLNTVLERGRCASEDGWDRFDVWEYEYLRKCLFKRLGLEDHYLCY